MVQKKKFNPRYLNYLCLPSTSVGSNGNYCLLTMQSHTVWNSSELKLPNEAIKCLWIPLKTTWVQHSYDQGIMTTMNIRPCDMLQMVNGEDKGLLQIIKSFLMKDLLCSGLLILWTASNQNFYKVWLQWFECWQPLQRRARSFRSKDDQIINIVMREQQQKYWCHRHRHLQLPLMRLSTVCNIL